MSRTSSGGHRRVTLALVALAAVVLPAAAPATASSHPTVVPAGHRDSDRIVTSADAGGQRTPRALPPGSIRHQNSRYWVWFGPRNWLSVDNPNGILITSATNRLRLDEGFSSLFCASGATVAESVNNQFAQQRRSIFNGFRQTWRNARMTASAIRRLPASAYGPLYFRQVLQASGVERGVPYRSVVSVDYSLAGGPQNCISRIVGMTAPANGFARSLAVLRSVQASKSYFPPGVP